MKNEWTFAEYLNEEWVHDSYKSKDQAIVNGFNKFNDNTIVIGQLISNGLNYKIENKEVIEYSKSIYLTSLIFTNNDINCKGGILNNET